MCIWVQGVLFLYLGFRPYALLILQRDKGWGRFIGGYRFLVIVILMMIIIVSYYRFFWIGGGCGNGGYIGECWIYCLSTLDVSNVMSR